tara:strand:+ start:1760 stop:2083 length:324 start_codon:yes stop_codon:yes gene_type:complete
MSYTSLLRQTCTIQRATISTIASGGGEREQTFANLATDVRCLIQPTGGAMFARTYSRDLDADFLGFFLAAQDIAEGDRVIEGGVTYTVRLVSDAAGQDHHKEVSLAR